jgi:hypothetical protein
MGKGSVPPLRPTVFCGFVQYNFLKLRGFDSFPKAKKVNADAPALL